MEKAESIAIKKYKAKSKNRRIEITLWKNTSDGNMFFQVQTKRLVDFKLRQITTVDNIYTVETMVLLSELSNDFCHDPVVKKAINPFMKFGEWDCKAINFKKDEK